MAQDETIVQHMPQCHQLTFYQIWDANQQDENGVASCDEQDQLTGIDD